MNEAAQLILGFVGVLVGALSTFALFSGRIAVHERRFTEIDRQRTEDLQRRDKEREEDKQALDAQLSEIRRAADRLTASVERRAQAADRRERWMMDVLSGLAKHAGLSHRFSDILNRVTEENDSEGG